MEGAWGACDRFGNLGKTVMTDGAIFTVGLCRASRRVPKGTGLAGRVNILGSFCFAEVAGRAVPFSVGTFWAVETWSAVRAFSVSFERV